MSTLVLTAEVLAAARRFFEDRGAEGCEGTAMIARSSKGAVRLVIPRQRAGVAPTSWVEVTEDGKDDLLLALGPDESYVARIHSHPVQAFHSATDDANPALTFDGAFSIVVP